MTTPTARRARRSAAVAAAIAIVLLAGACSSDSDEQAETTSEASSASGSPTTEASEERGEADADDGRGERGEVLGSSTGQHRADPNDITSVPLRLDVRSVERLSGDTVQVKLSITNTGDGATFKPYRELSDPTVPGAAYDIGGVALLDRPGDKKYLTLYDTDDTCLCTGGLDDIAIAPGETATMYADVTAPPESVKTVDLSVPGFDPVAGLAIR